MKCFICGERESCKKVDGKSLCYECRNYSSSTFKCFQCNEVHLTENAGYTSCDDESMCTKCLGMKQEDFKIIEDYNYVPRRYTFYKEKGERHPLFMGFELELESIEDEVDDSLIKLNKFIYKEEISKYFYIKSDSSIDYGFEIVSFPATLKYMKKHYKLDKLCKFLQTIMKADDTCGFHVHIPRKTLAVKELVALQHFAYVNREELFSLSGRRAEWFLSTDRDVKEVLKTADCFSFVEVTKEDISKSKLYNYKYIAIAPRAQTIEFRFFGSSLNSKQINNNFQVIQSLISYCKATKPKVIGDYPEFKHFEKFLLRNEKFDAIKPIIKEAGEKLLWGVHTY